MQEEVAASGTVGVPEAEVTRRLVRAQPVGSFGETNVDIRTQVALVIRVMNRLLSHVKDRVCTDSPIR